MVIPESPVELGTAMPDIHVELLTKSSDGSTETNEVSILDALGGGTSILVGMPGAFTPTCSSEHLPGYIEAAPSLKNVGVDKVVIVTTNDKFVNEEWASKAGLFQDDAQDMVSIAADGDATLVTELGLVEDMGPGLGLRSKRFAVVSEKGVIRDIQTDEGMKDCVNTKASNLVALLTPEVEEEESSLSTEAAGALVGGIALLGALFYTSTGNVATVATTPPVPPATPEPAIERQEPIKKFPGSKKKASSFSLLNKYS